MTAPAVKEPTYYERWLIDKVLNGLEQEGPRGLEEFLAGGERNWPSPPDLVLVLDMVLIGLSSTTESHSTDRLMTFLDLLWTRVRDQGSKYSPEMKEQLKEKLLVLAPSESA